jgi:hypothetical protein
VQDVRLFAAKIADATAGFADDHAAFGGRHHRVIAPGGGLAVELETTR